MVIYLSQGTCKKTRKIKTRNTVDIERDLAAHLVCLVHQVDQSCQETQTASRSLSLLITTNKQ